MQAEKVMVVFLWFDICSIDDVKKKEEEEARIISCGFVLVTACHL